MNVKVQINFYSDWYLGKEKEVLNWLKRIFTDETEIDRDPP